MRNIVSHTGYADSRAATGMSDSEAENFIKQYLEGFVSSDKPSILHMAGIPGSGKSTYVRQLPPSGAIVIGFDDVMEKLSGYQQDRATLGNDAAFRKWELCAREIGYEILFRALEKKLDVIFDNSGSRPDHVELLRYLKEKEGYRIEVTAILIDEELAVARASKRDRYLPPEYIPARKQALENLLPDYRALADSYQEFKATPKGNMLIKTGRKRLPKKSANS